MKRRQWFFWYKVRFFPWHLKEFLCCSKFRSETCMLKTHTAWYCLNDVFRKSSDVTLLLDIIARILVLGAQHYFSCCLGGHFVSTLTIRICNFTQGISKMKFAVLRVYRMHLKLYMFRVDRQPLSASLTACWLHIAPFHWVKWCKNGNFYEIITLQHQVEHHICKPLVGINSCLDVMTACV